MFLRAAEGNGSGMQIGRLGAESASPGASIGWWSDRRCVAVSERGLSQCRAPTATSSSRQSSPSPVLQLGLPCNHGDGGRRTHRAPTTPTAHPQHARCHLHSRCYLGRRLPSRPHSTWSMRRPANTGPPFTMPVSSVRVNGGEQLLAGWGWSYLQGRASGYQRPWAERS